ncbi:MAG: NfeD family protein [Gaiellales bacterium]|jgi:membrane protein implicated in regulation of membrane protease activity|nr:NfeD family protein [Gaiellales bacterium]
MPDWAIWIVIAVVALAVEATTTAFFTVYFGVAAAVVALLAAVGVPVEAQILSFGVLSVGGLVLTRPWLLRIAGDRSPTIATGVDAMPGRIGVVTSPIGELDSGLVKIHGETWTARSYFDRERIPEGARVEVVEIRGVTALVIPAPADRDELPAPEES